LAGFLCLCWATAARAGGTPPPAEFDLESFLRELDVRLAEITALDGTRPDQLRARALEIRESLPGEWTVKNGTDQVRVPAEWLRRQLAEVAGRPGPQAEAVRRSAIDKLAALRAQAAALQRSTAGPDATAASERLAGILARREFRGVRRPGARNWFERLRERVGRWIDEMLFRAFGRVAEIPLAGEMLVWTLVALAFIVVAIWVKRTVNRQLQREEPLPVLAAPSSKDWRRWARDALAAAERGDYREAVHRAYWCGIHRLVEAGLWSAERARTPREYLRALPPGHAYRAPLASLTRRFEQSWYGGRPATADDFRATTAELEQMQCPLG